jgi:hypothetical protein
MTPENDDSLAGTVGRDEEETEYDDDDNVFGLNFEDDSSSSSRVLHRSSANTTHEETMNSDITHFDHTQTPFNTVESSVTTRFTPDWTSAHRHGEQLQNLVNDNLPW